MIQEPGKPPTILSNDEVVELLSKQGQEINRLIGVIEMKDKFIELLKKKIFDKDSLIDMLKKEITNDFDKDKNKDKHKDDNIQISITDIKENRVLSLQESLPNEINDYNF